MLFSTKAEYGLRALSNLDPQGKKAVSLAKIAREEGLSLAYLERIFASLRKSGLVRASKGSSGGYFLLPSAKKVSLLEVLEILEGPVHPASCVIKPKNCHCLNCKIMPIWHKLDKEVRQILYKIKVKEIFN